MMTTEGALHENGWGTLDLSIGVVVPVGIELPAVAWRLRAVLPTYRELLESIVRPLARFKPMASVYLAGRFSPTTFLHRSTIRRSLLLLVWKNITAVLRVIWRDLLLLRCVTLISSQLSLKYHILIGSKGGVDARISATWLGGLLLHLFLGAV